MLSYAAVTVMLLFFLMMRILLWTENKDDYTVQISFDTVGQSSLTFTMEWAK
jgi:hypothetical protein